MARLLMLTALALALAACDTTAGRTVRGFFQPSKGQPALEVGLKQYDDGNYGASARNLNLALEYGLSDGERLAELVPALALAAQPGLELDAAETGHPVWGPVFRSVKASR